MPRDQDLYRHDYLTGRLNENFALERVQLWRGRYAEGAYEDFAALESMITLVGQVRRAQHEDERDYHRSRALDFALGRRSALYSGIELAA